MNRRLVLGGFLGILLCVGLGAEGGPGREGLLPMGPEDQSTWPDVSADPIPDGWPGERESCVCTGDPTPADPAGPMPSTPESSAEPIRR